MRARWAVEFVFGGGAQREASKAGRLPSCQLVIGLRVQLVRLMKQSLLSLLYCSAVSNTKNVTSGLVSLSLRRHCLAVYIKSQPNS